MSKSKKNCQVFTEEMVERLDHKNVKKIKTKYSFKRDINIKNIDILDFVQFVQTTSLPTNLSGQMNQFTYQSV